MLKNHKIEHLISRKTIPNLILHGHTRSCIYTLKYILKQIYPNMGKIYLDERVEKVNSKLITIPIFYSNIHVEVLISDFGYNSRTLLPKLLLELASTKNIMTNQHKIIVLHGVEELPRQTQYILRGNFEMIMKNCRVILLTKNINKLIEPLQSRCLDIRIANLFDNDKNKQLELIEKDNENLQLYENIIDNMIKNIYTLPFSTITEKLYLLMTKNVSFADILKRTLETIRKLYKNTKSQVIDFERIYELAAEYDERMNQSSRNFIHLQTFFIELRIIFYH